MNGTWLASCSRDFTVKVWDVRHSKREMVSWQGHQGGKDITAVAWHPIHLDLLASSESPLSKVPAHLAHLATIYLLGAVSKLPPGGIGRRGSSLTPDCVFVVGLAPCVVLMSVLAARSLPLLCCLLAPNSGRGWVHHFLAAGPA